MDDVSEKCCQKLHQHLKHKCKVMYIVRYGYVRVAFTFFKLAYSNLLYRHLYKPKINPQFSLVVFEML
jgi:hypothetical protein